MSPAQPIAWKHLRYVLILFAPLWVGTSILFAAGGVAYAILSKDYWTASQPLVLRDEASGAPDRLGRFVSQSELKAAQETTLEMARHSDVVAAALRAIGPPGGKPDRAWPTAETVAQTAKKRVNLRAPQGGDFGGSDMFYLQVEQESPQRAKAFCDALFESLTLQMRQVRLARADSMLAELVHARDLAQQNLDEVAARLRQIEVNFGSDLGELRSLTEAINGEGANRRAIEETSKELQAAELELERLEALHALLVRSLSDPTQLVISGGELLSRQPSLQRLKDGFIDAQLARSQLSGRFTAEHPRMRAAERTEAAIHRAMNEEIAAVIQSMQPVLEVDRDRTRRLRVKKDQLERRLERIAEVRTGYSKLAAEVKHRTTLLEQAQRALSDAQASRSAAMSTDLIAKLGPVTVADRPRGMSIRSLAMGGGAAGLIFGLGAVFLVAPGPYQARLGRRWSDRLGGRRLSDASTAATMPATYLYAGPAAKRRSSD